MVVQCPSCGAEALEIDAQCPSCHEPLISEEARRRVGTTVLEHYEITEVLGQGGMSVVYRGRHRITGQEVALKILPPELAAHGQVKSRFLEEARALAQLDHPNIVHLYNFGQDDACLILAMQYVPGSTWERLILGGGIDWPTSVRIAIDVLGALEMAHSRGIIHRDMKPSNVLVRPDGSALVMDFGIAKMATSTRLTATGQTMGTVRYMSPEQVRGLEIDPRTDIYSLSITLYESLCGQTPFDGDSHFEIMKAHLVAPPPPLSQHGAAVPPELEGIVMAGLGKQPDERPPSALAMRRALEEVLAAAGQAGPLLRRPLDPAPPLATAASSVGLRGPAGGRARPPRPLLWVGLGGAALLAGAAVVFLVKAETGSASGSGGGAARAAAAAADPGPAAPGDWPEAHLLDGVDLAVDQRYEADRLRVLAVVARDPSAVRASVARARRDFAAYLASQGVAERPEPYPLNVVIVPARLMCDDRVYESGAAPADCATRDFWYRPRERTLYLPDDAAALEARLAFAIAVGTCLHGEVPGCDAMAVQFSETLARE